MSGLGDLYGVYQQMTDIQRRQMAFYRQAIQQQSLRGLNGYRQSNPQIYGGTANAANNANHGAIAIAYQLAAAIGVPRNSGTPREGIRAGEIIAWRVWYYEEAVFVKNSDTKCGPCLTSLTTGDPWPYDDPVVGDVETQGVHVWKTRKDADDYSPIGVLGTVLLWGEIVEHQFGYRAQYAKVNSIDEVRGYGFFTNRKRIKKLRRAYGV